MKRLRQGMLIAATAWLMMATMVQARINVVNLPGRDSTQLTIYNSVDLTMVKETRHLTLRKGLNRLEFSWANTLIDPTSVEFRALDHADQVEVLDVSFPPRVTNTLEWRLQSEYAGEVEVEIRYFTSGISWAADYVAEAARHENEMTLEGLVRVTNRSGEDYENAQVRLVVGVIRLVENIVDLARREEAEMTDKDASKVARKVETKRKAGVAMGRAVTLYGMAGAAKKEITKEAMSEYFLYTVEGRDTIPDGWAKRLPSFKTAHVPMISLYKFEQEQNNAQVIRYYRFKNDEASKLGREPLPDGRVMAVRQAAEDGSLAFVGQTQVKYIPVKEQVDIELGPDQEVQVKPVMMDYAKTDIRFDNKGNVAGWTITERWEIELRNSKDIGVTVDLRRNFAGDWSLQTDAAYEKVDARKIKFMVPLKAHEAQTLRYEVTTRHGLNATK